MNLLFCRILVLCSYRLLTLLLITLLVSFSIMGLGIMEEEELPLEQIDLLQLGVVEEAGLLREEVEGEEVLLKGVAVEEGLVIPLFLKAEVEEEEVLLFLTLILLEGEEVVAVD